MPITVFIKTLIVTSSAFSDGNFIPSKYTCEGQNISPPISIKAIPSNTKSMVLIIEDPDAASGSFIHWIVWNIKAEPEIKENSIPGEEGNNSIGKKGYYGPCPPEGTHHYIFKVYALDTVIDPGSKPDKRAIEKAMKGHIVGEGELTGLYKKQSK
jgi:Raf kinase inhibitor-like YbhB/YbcL family protein